MATLYRTHMTVVPADIAVVEAILKINGVNYLKEFSEGDGAWWVLFMTRDYTVVREINSALGITGNLDGVPA